MTEAEWWQGTDLHEFLGFLDGKASDRKMRLFTIACCRRIWPYLLAECSRRVVDLLEQAVEGAANEVELDAAGREARAYLDSDECRSTEVGCASAFAAASVTESYPNEKQVWVATTASQCTCDTLYWVAFEAAVRNGDDDRRAAVAGETAQHVEAKSLAGILRDIVGNPFHPVAADPRWRSTDVLGLARAIYEDRAFDRLPLLADALMDAGCHEEGILNHCRGDGPHVRGCWVVDLVLGKQ
jgi:hypothetical protein